jgi:hypothetical protein
LQRAEAPRSSNRIGSRCPRIPLAPITTLPTAESFAEHPPEQPPEQPRCPPRVLDPSLFGLDCADSAAQSARVQAFCPLGVP